MPKERSINPATAHQKAQKQKALKKSKAALQTQRQAQLARRNPERLQREIDNLKAEQDASAGQLRPRDRQRLEQLERDVGAIRKAREREGADESPAGAPSSERRGDRKENDVRRGGASGSTLGKRRRDGSDARDGGRHDEQDSAEDKTDDEVRNIPMPRDTPPPIPRTQKRRDPSVKGEPSADAASEKAGARQPAQTTYAAAPQMRDLRKEATARFVPAAVARQLKAVKGEGPGGKLLEPEELERLEEAGYVATGATTKPEAVQLDSEEERFRRELEGVNELDGAIDAGKREQLRVSAVEDGKAAVEAATAEAVHDMMNEEVVKGKLPAAKVEKHLRHVEIEEVDDEDL